MLKPGLRAESSFPTRSSFASLEFERGVLTAHLVGPTAAEREAMILSREINEAFEALGRGIRSFVLDLSNVRTMSSMALGMCIDARQRARTLGARTIVFGLCPQLEELFHMTKVDRLYKIARDEAELNRALAA